LDEYDDEDSNSESDIDVVTLSYIERIKKYLIGYNIEVKHDDDKSHNDIRK
jgi:hypothetical protein